MGHEVFVAQPDLSSFIVQRDVVHAVKELIEILSSMVLACFG
jgi:hypothetical protein